jgi:hypothetical protein
VQDDSDELAQEIVNQAKIYQNGVVTILAGGAVGADQGFLHQRSRIYPRYCISLMLPNGKVTRLTFDHRQGRTDTMELLGTTDPVDKRAWIFQESKPLVTPQAALSTTLTPW